MKPLRKPLRELMPYPTFSWNEVSATVWSRSWMDLSVARVGIINLLRASLREEDL